jgi:hypothetical protein
LSRRDPAQGFLLEAVTQSDSQCIGCIGLRRIAEIQQNPHHMLYLLLVCTTFTNHRLLDFTRCVLGNRQCLHNRGADGSTPRLTEFQRRTGITLHEDSLYGELLRPVFGHELAQFPENQAQLIGKTVTGDLKTAAGDIT